jgi:hypothetical protein
VGILSQASGLVFLLYQKGKGLDGSSSYPLLYAIPARRLVSPENEAAPPLESPLAVDPLGFGVDLRKIDFDVFRPERHQC